MVSISLPPTVAFRDSQLSADGQQLSPGKHLQEAFEKARESEGVAQTPRDNVEALMLCWRPTGDCGAEQGGGGPTA